MTDPRADSSTSPDSGPAGRGRWPWLVGGAVLAALAVTIAVAVVGGAGGQPVDDPSPASSPTASETPGSTAPATPVPSAAPSASATPSPSTVPFDAEVPLGAEVTARVTQLEAVEGEASSPGEVAGPSVRVTIDIANPTGEEVSLQSVAVNAYYGADQVPALTLQAPGGVAFPQSVPAGASAQGIYVFSIPSDARDDVSVTVDLASEQAQVVFRGVAPR